MQSFKLSCKGVKKTSKPFSNYATLSGKVMGLEKQVKVAEDKPCETIKSEVASREVMVLEAKKYAIEEFKQSEEDQAS